MKGYFKHFVEPFPILLPLNILEELIKPLTLALRLFGNIFAGGIMLALIGLMPLYLLWAPNLLWKLFDMAIGGIQAFIFALLTVLYFAMARAPGTATTTARSTPTTRRRTEHVPTTRPPFPRPDHTVGSAPEVTPRRRPRRQI